MAKRTQKASDPDLPPPDLGGDGQKPPGGPTLVVPPSDEPDDNSDEPDDNSPDDEKDTETPKSEVDASRRIFEEGVGVGAAPPDPSRAQPPPIERRLNMRPVDDAINRRMTEGPVGVGADDTVDNLALALQSFSSKCRYRVLRTSPEGMPAQERGPWNWTTIIGTPSADRVRDEIMRRFGGGSFEIVVADFNEAELQTKRTTIIDIGGEPIMQTVHGRQWYQTTTGLRPLMASTDADGKPISVPAISSSDPGGVLGMWLQMNDAAEQRKAMAAENDKSRENSLAAAVIQSLAANRPQPALNGTMILSLLPIVMEFLKEMRADRRDREDRLEKRLSEANKPQSAMDIMVQIQPMFALMQKRAELEMSDYSKRSQQLFDLSLSKLRDDGHEEEAGFLATMGKEIASKSGDIIATMLPMLTAALSGGSVAQMAQMMGGMPPQQQDPRLAAARGQQALPQGPRPMQPRPVRPAAPAAPVAPPPAAAAPSQPEAGSSPAEPQASQPPAEPSQNPGESSQPATEVPPAPPPPTRPPPGAFMARVSMQALAGWLSYTREFAEGTPDPVDIWDAVFDGQAMRVMFGMAPVLFRQRVQTTDIEKEFSVEAWVEGADPSILEVAREFDAFLQANATGRAWLVEYLDAGPWVEDDDDEDAP